MTAKYPWPVPAEADVQEALAGVIGDMQRGLPPKIEEALILLADLSAARDGRDGREL